MIQTGKIHIPAIHDDVGAGLGNNPIQRLNIMNFAVRDVDKYWDRTLDIDHRVEFHGSFGASKVGPGKQSETQIDCGGVQRVNGSLKVQSEVRIGIEGPCNLNQSLCEIGIDSPVAEFVRISKSGFFDEGSETRVVQLSAMHPQTDFDVAETLSISQLCECHREELLPTGELSNAKIPVVTFNASTEFIVRDVFNELGENGPTAVHRCDSFSPEDAESLLNREKISNRLNRFPPLMH